MKENEPKIDESQLTPEQIRDNKFRIPKGLIIFIAILLVLIVASIVVICICNSLIK